MALKIVRDDITRMSTEAIVNTANTNVAVGDGCDRAVYEAAGYEELLSYRKAQIGPVPEGEVFVTPGFGLKAKYIIHAVSPVYRGGEAREEEKLRSCYHKSLELAGKRGITSIAFPLISTGSFGYPREEGLRIAMDEIHGFLLHRDMDVYLVVFDEASAQLEKKIAPSLEEYIDRNYVEERLKAERQPGAEERMHEETCPEAGRQSELPKPRNKGIRNALGSVLRLGRNEKRGAGKDFPGAGGIDIPEFRFEAAVNEKWKASVPEEDVLEEPELCSAASVFEEEHESRLDERIKHTTDTFSQYLLYLIGMKGMENAEVYKRAIVDKKIFSKIKNNVDYHPQKLTALCLCVGAKLNLDQTKDLLARAGYALSPCDKTDIIFSYFIENGIYDMIELDIQLEEHGLPCIIT